MDLELGFFIIILSDFSDISVDTKLFHYITLAGDVMLLEAGPSFVQKHSKNGKSFALVSVVENSTPPRLRMFIPALGKLSRFVAFYLF